MGGAKIMRKTMLYHISTHVMYSNGFGHGMSPIDTLLPGHSINVSPRHVNPQQTGSKGSLLMINHRARVVRSDILTDNGVIHLIDEVLIPCEASLDEMMAVGDLSC